MKTLINRIIRQPLTYFLITFIMGWSLFGILIFTEMGNTPVVKNILFLLAMMGPGITGVLFSCIRKSEKGMMDYGKRIAGIMTLSKGWLAVIIGFPFLIKALAGIIDGFTGGTGLRWAESAGMLFSDPARLFPVVIYLILIPVFQETGWRGYAQNLLQEKRNALSASIILGVVWSLWYIPVSLIPFAGQAAFGVARQEYWMPFSRLFLLSIVISWVYVNTNRSLPAVIMFHAMIFLTDEIISLSDSGEYVYILCLFSAAITILLGFGQKMRLNHENVHGIRMKQGLFFPIMLTGLIALTGIREAVPENRQTLKSGFLTVLEESQLKYGFPGATAACILPDGTVEAIATGQADREHHIPMTPDSRMLAASIGKTFVAATAVALVQENRLELDAPVSKWMSGFSWFRQVPNHETITLRQLLTHSAGIQNHVETAGFRSAFSNNWQHTENPFSPAELVAFILDQPGLFKPGEGWYYSDTGYILVGLIIEKVTGRSYYEEVTSRFLRPLHLAFTAPSDRLELPDLASGYMAAENEFNLPEKSTVEPGKLAWHPGIEWTGGGLISNAQDLVRWAKSLYEGKAMEGNYLPSLLQAVPVSREHPDVRYGLGVAIHQNGPFGPTYGHGGWIPGYCSSLRYYPEYGVAIAFQINTDIGMDQAIEKMEAQFADVIITGLNK